MCGCVADAMGVYVWVGGVTQLEEEVKRLKAAVVELKGEDASNADDVVASLPVPSSTRQVAPKCVNPFTHAYASAGFCCAHSHSSCMTRLPA